MYILILGTHSEFDIFGFICHLDLFPVSRPESSPTHQRMTSQTTLRYPRAHSSSLSSGSLSPLSPPSPMFPRVDGDFPMEDALDYHDVPQAAPLSQNPASHVFVLASADAPCTQYLAGETFVSCSLVEHEGGKAAMFVFSVRCYHHSPP